MKQGDVDSHERLLPSALTVSCFVVVSFFVVDVGDDDDDDDDDDEEYCLVVVVDQQLAQRFDVLLVGPRLLADHRAREVACAAAEDDERRHEEQHEDGRRDRLAGECRRGWDERALLAVSSL